MKDRVQNSGWNQQYQALLEFKRRTGHFRIPRYDPESRILAKWLAQQCSLGEMLPLHRLEKLYQVGVQFPEVHGLWIVQFFKLKRFHECEGHCNVWDKGPSHSSLAKWIVKQRVQYHQGKLRLERHRLLNALGFDWNPLETVWRTRCQELRQFKARFGHCNVPQHHVNRKLARWVVRQRLLCTRGILPPEKKAALDALDFDWQPRQTHWEKRFTQLCEFVIKHRHCHVPMSREYDRLHHWAKLQRKNRKHLTAEQVRRLEAIGFEWPHKTPRDISLEKRLSECQAYLREHGGKEGAKNFAFNKELQKWILHQRRNVNRLGRRRRRLLSKFGFLLKWERQIPTFEDRLKQLRQFKREHGHCDVSTSTNRPLAGWLILQRRKRKNNRLSPPCRRALENLGVVWDPKETAWEAQFQTLCDFRQRHGHCNIPHGFNKRLYKWIDCQRMLFAQGKLRADRRRRLEGLGLVWNRLDTMWKKRWAQLRIFHHQFGHWQVPYGSSKHAPLRRWMDLQRNYRCRGILDPKRKAKLDTLGFIWDHKQTVWDKHLANLKKFRKRFGHFRISPSSSREFPGLCCWTYWQRRYEREGRLDLKHKAKLNAIGFVWKR